MGVAHARVIRDMEVTCASHVTRCFIKRSKVMTKSHHPVK